MFNWNMLWEVTKTIGSGIAGVFGAMFPSLNLSGTQSTIMGFYDFVIKGIETVKSYVVPTIQNIFGAVVTAINWVRPIVIQGFNVLLGVWSALASAASASVSVVGSVLSSMGSWISGLVGDWSTFWDVAQKRAIMALLGIEFGFRNFQEIAAWALNSVLVKAVSFGNTIAYFFTEVIPGVLSWLANNWKNILHDMFETAYTTFINLSKNIVTIIKNIPALIRGSKSLSDIWTPLTTGAEYALSELPNIPDRVMGDFEKALSEDVDRMGKNLGKNWEELKKKRFEQLFPEKIKSPVEEIKSDITKIKPIQIIDTQQASQAVADTAGQMASALSQKSEIKFAKIAERGSDEARTAVLQHRFGIGKENIQQEQLTETQKQTGLLETIAGKQTPTTVQTGGFGILAEQTPTTPITAPTPPKSKTSEDLGDVCLLLERVNELLTALPGRLASVLPTEQTVSI